MLCCMWHHSSWPVWWWVGDDLGRHRLLLDSNSSQLLLCPFHQMMWHPWYPACISPPLRSDVLSNCSSPPLSLLKCILYISKSRMLWREHKFMLPAAVRRGLKRTQVASSSSSTTSIPLVGTSSASSSPSYPNRKKNRNKIHIYNSVCWRNKKDKGPLGKGSV